MSKLFITGIGGILLSGVFAAVLMISNVDAQDARMDACTFSSGYGIGARACSDSLNLTASPRATAQRVAYLQASTVEAARN